MWDVLANASFVGLSPTSEAASECSDCPTRSTVSTFRVPAGHAGAELSSSSRDLRASGEYNDWRVAANASRSFSDNTVLVRAVAGGRLGNDRLPADGQLQWGGLLRQSGYATGQQLGSEFTFRQVTDTHRITRGSPLYVSMAGCRARPGVFANHWCPPAPPGICARQHCSCPPIP